MALRIFAPTLRQNRIWLTSTEDSLASLVSGVGSDEAEHLHTYKVQCKTIAAWNRVKTAENQSSRQTARRVNLANEQPKGQ